MAIYQHSAWKTAEIEFIFVNSKKQDKLDHLRDDEIMDCEFANIQNKGKLSNMRLKASYGMDAKEYKDTWGHGFVEDIHTLSYS